MASGNLDLIRGVYERWGEGDFASGEPFDPLILFVMGEGLPDAGSYLGLEELAEYMRGFLEPWERITIEADEVIEAGDSVFVAVSQRGTGQGSGAAAELHYFHVWTFRAGRAIRLETVRDRDEALAKAGIPG
jgi:ketosteroid isomerase-like protein